LTLLIIQFQFRMGSVFAGSNPVAPTKKSMSQPARFLLGTIIVGILVLFLCGLALRRPAVATDPFDKPASSSAVR
jgi:hypothetical protein